MNLKKLSKEELIKLVKNGIKYCHKHLFKGTKITEDTQTVVLDLWNSEE